MSVVKKRWVDLDPQPIILPTLHPVVRRPSTTFHSDVTIALQHVPVVRRAHRCLCTECSTPAQQDDLFCNWCGTPLFAH